MKVHSIINGSVIFETENGGEKSYTADYSFKEYKNVNYLIKKLKEKNFKGIFNDEQIRGLAEIGFRRRSYAYGNLQPVHAETWVKMNGGNFEINIKEGKKITFMGTVEMDIKELKKLSEILDQI